MVVIRTPRLELVPGTRATLRAELLGAHELGAELVAEIPDSLVDYSWASGLVDTGIAETLPDLRPSIGVLEKTGFELLGEGSEPGVIRFSRPSDDAWGTGARANSCTG